MSNVIPAVESVFALSLYFRKFLIYSPTRAKLVSDTRAILTSCNIRKQYSFCESKEFT